MVQDSATDNPSVNIIPLKDGTVMAVSGEPQQDQMDLALITMSEAPLHEWGALLVR